MFKIPYLKYSKNLKNYFITQQHWDASIKTKKKPTKKYKDKTPPKSWYLSQIQKYN